VIGRRILAEVGGFEPYLDVVELHHENWDGSGYPHGLAGERIPLAARIVHVVDAYDAMTSDRPYRRGMHHAEALAVLERFAGSQFDPAAVACFRQVVAPQEEEDGYQAHAASMNRLLERVGEQRAALSEVAQKHEASI
jgi:HD-GYP domain-containing protein (c-di-GMP phosphodiesterase class II)